MYGLFCKNVFVYQVFEFCTYIRSVVYKKSAHFLKKNNPSSPIHYLTTASIYRYTVAAVIAHVNHATVQ